MVIRGDDGAVEFHRTGRLNVSRQFIGCRIQQHDFARDGALFLAASISGTIIARTNDSQRKFSNAIIDFVKYLTLSPPRRAAKVAQCHTASLVRPRE
jgi:hypothetical protein